MANLASINSEFSDFSSLDSSFKIRFVNATRGIDLTFTWVCKSIRAAAFQYMQGVDGGDQGQKALIGVADDIGNSSLFPYMNVSHYIDSFAIEANEYGWVITDEGGVFGSNITLTEVPEVVPVKNFQLTGYALSQATTPCDDITVTVTENDGVAPYSWIAPVNVSTTLIAEIARAVADQAITITLEDADTDQDSLLNVVIPRIFTNAEIADISVVTNPGGLSATVTALMGTQDFGTYLYSIDGSNYQVSNVFEDVEAGDFTLYVNDGYGCIVSTIFSVVLPAAANYFRIAKLNAIEFKIPDGNRQNIDNTLFVDMQLPYRAQVNKYCQVYFSDDSPCPVQFQSNFASHTVKIYNFETKALIATTTPVIVYDSPENFRYWEFTIDFSLYPGITIQIQVIPTGQVIGGGNVAISEPIDIRTSDPYNEFVKVQYLSNINCSDIYWMSGFNPYLYVKGQAAETLPIINKEVARDCSWNQNTQTRELIRQIQFKVSRQPAYIFEKLQWALGNGQGNGNYYLVNDMSVNGEAGAFEEPSFTDKYSLGDSQANLEQKDVFTGNLSLTPAPPVTINYLLVNPENEGGLLVSPTDEFTLV